MRRRRVLLVSPLPPPVGGIATWTKVVLASPLAQRFELCVVDSSPRETEGVKSRQRFRTGRAIAAARILFGFCAQLIRRRPDLVHVNTSYYWAMARDGILIWLAWGLRVQVVVQFHGGDFPAFAEGLPAPLRRLLRVTLARVARLIAITRETQDYLSRSGGADRVHYLPNFVLHADAADVAPPAPRADARTRVLFVGWLVEAKGIAELFRAAAALPQADFVLVGPYSSEYEAELRAHAAAAGGNVRIEGPRSPEDVRRLYASADLFVLPSHREGFPMTILEAMAAGLPIVTTAVGAIPDIVRDGVDGFVVPARDAAALTERLARLVDDPALRARMGRSAVERFRARFDADVVTRQLGDLYLELIGADR